MGTAGYVALAFVTALVGAVGGLGGAVLLVPALIATGTSVTVAAPLGLVSVAAGSVAAGARQLTERTVNHRLGVVTELFASSGAVGGAVVSGLVTELVLTYLLATVALAAALAGGGRKGLRNAPSDRCDAGDVGERVGRLAGAYPSEVGIVPYRPRRLAPGLAFVGLSGVVAGLAGVSGGFIKTPAMSEIMWVPTRVAAATTTFTVGITSAAALVVFALQGRIDVELSAAVLLGALLGGRVGAELQSRISGPAIRRALSVVLVVVAVVLVVQA